MLLLNELSYLVILLSFPVLIYLFHFRKKRGGRLLWSFKLWRLKPYRLKPVAAIFLSKLSYLLFWLAAFLLVISLSGPESTTTERLYFNRGAAIMLVLDESPSMAARDIGGESRFELAKDAIRRFISSRENDEIGLISFGREAALRVPLTLDYNFLLTSLDAVRIMELGDGTNIGMALALAALHLSHIEGRNRVVILVTDGDNNAGEIHPLTAIDILNSLGVTAFTIGVGRPGVVNVSFIHPQTGVLIDGIINDASYDEELLRRIAEQTGGLFFRAESFWGFDSAFQAVNNLERSDTRFRLITLSTAYNRQFLLVAFILALISLAIRALILREVV
ncbi:MAG: VWA domain-containing protein [Spirochaetaceae bacterium]|nr:VWA domain-containing protein [Spirochaetaceae bacterium]